MAMVPSFLTTNDDLKEHLDYYVTNIVAAKETKKLAEARLYLSKASTAKQTPSLSQVDVTQLEVTLMEAVRILRNLAMDRQILNVALQKSIQSTLLYVTKKNLFRSERLNYVEQCVAMKMKRMLENSEILCWLKEEVDKHVSYNTNVENKLLGKMAYQQERMLQLESTDENDDQARKMNEVQKKITNMNKMRTLFTLLVNHASDKDCCEKKKLFELTLKYRAPRSLNYYKNSL